MIQGERKIAFWRKTASRRVLSKFHLKRIFIESRLDLSTRTIKFGPLMEELAENFDQQKHHKRLLSTDTWVGKKLVLPTDATLSFLNAKD